MKIIIIIGNTLHIGCIRREYNNIPITDGPAYFSNDGNYFN